MEQVAKETTMKVTELDYDTQMVRSVHADSAMNEILDKIEEIDFHLIYYHDNPGMINHILSLREEKAQSNDFKYISNINDKLYRLEPSVEVKYTIIIKYLLKIAEEAGLSISNIDGNPYIYNGCYWKIYDSKLFSCFLSLLWPQNLVTISSKPLKIHPLRCMLSNSIQWQQCSNLSLASNV